MSETVSLESSAEKPERKSYTQKLGEFEQSTGIVNLPTRDEQIEEMFAASADDIAQKSKKELFYLCYSLSRYSLYISDQQALYVAKYHSAEKFLGKRLSELAPQYGGFTFEERKMAALNDPLNKLDKLHSDMIEWEMYANRFKGLSYKIEELIKRIENFTKL